MNKFCLTYRNYCDDFKAQRHDGPVGIHTFKLNYSLIHGLKQNFRYNYIRYYTSLEEIILTFELCDFYMPYSIESPTTKYMREYRFSPTRILPYKGEYGSVKTRILAYFIQ